MVLCAWNCEAKAEELRVCAILSNKRDPVSHTDEPSSQQVETGRSGVCGHPWLCSELEDSLGHLRSDCVCVGGGMCVLRQSLVAQLSQKVCVCV